MNNNFPTYTIIFKETQIRLKEMRKICSQNKEIDEVDELMFYLVGNINLRINTIFHLLENDITDGVIPLQRTLFELQVAFNAFTSAEDKVKKKYVKLFNKKNNFETTNKLNKYFQSNNEEIKNIVTSEEIEQLSQLKNKALEQIKSENLEGRKPEFKPWYELASGKSLKDLSNEFQKIAYYPCYDEPSNWVHPQRIIENMDFETFNQQMPFPFYGLMLRNMYWSIEHLLNNIAFLADHSKITENDSLYVYGENLVELSEKLKILGEIHRY
ncbi:hypothetical protein COE95_18300 [Bacillus toyonensis]|uniref:DUF5677 domain-containing protein n=1 Tax=Bacillus toyonensis TaxID=155322 RepID=UPI000BF8AC26|nr:DUF5677 domain-containing protein [Bacillus toyonensis]PEP88781.1 hypothetical protein CN583_25810 [Bacillus toyonensis]PHC29324.1 hypothetical protein COE95_18300 [Bacillus toyonensis]